MSLTDISSFCKNWLASLPDIFPEIILCRIACSITSTWDTPERCQNGRNNNIPITCTLNNMWQSNYYFKLGVDSISQLPFHKLCIYYKSDYIKCTLFNNHNSSYSLRHSDFSIPGYNTVTFGKHSLRYLGPRLWQKLPPDLTSAKNLNIFKSRIHKNDISSMIHDGCKSCSLYTS